MSFCPVQPTARPIARSAVPHPGNGQATTCKCAVCKYELHFTILKPIQSCLCFLVSFAELLALGVVGVFEALTRMASVVGDFVIAVKMDRFRGESYKSH